MNYLFSIYLLCGLISCSIAEFTPDFNNFLDELYGVEAQKFLERKDFQNGGSFGGKLNSSDEIKNEPVVIVHGITNLITYFDFVRNFLLENNYNRNEIYGTTYGGGPSSYLIFVKLQCQYVKQVRALIRAVHLYSGKKVDVLAFSMGSPISRKAILGGKCDDEELGAPLTDIIDTYVGVAGANYGSELCIVPWFVCSRRNGLHCKSKFLNDINSQPARYEGTHSYAIYSTADEKVGTDCCGAKCSSIPFSEQEFEYEGFDHDGVMVKSLRLQLSLIRNHNGTAPTERKPSKRWSKISILRLTF